MNNIERQLQLCLNKRRPKNLVSETILIGELYNFNSGSGWSPHLLQKCIPRVYSDIQEQEMGVPQGSILSVTLFSIKINSFAKILNDNIEGSLYVDDFLICYRAKNMNSIAEP
jgi:hypothetical protein